MSSLGGPLNLALPQTQATFATAVQTAFNDAISAGRLRLPNAALVNNIFSLEADDEDGVEFTGLFNVRTLPVTVNTSPTISTLGAVVNLLPNGQFTYDSRKAAQLQRLVTGETAADTFTYTLRDLVGQTSTYRVRDSLGAISNEARVTVTINSSPLAVPDSVRTNANTPVVIDVLRNDSDPDGTLNRSSVSIASGPDVGSAVVQSDGTIRYSPLFNFGGTATLQYSVLDNDGLASNFATVTIIVGGSIHQNPAGRLDVNADGSISPIDVLVLINDINFNGTRTLPSNLAIPPYLDPNGNGQLDPLDVLEIINFINARGNAGAGEGEALMANLGYSQEIVRTPTKDEISSAIQQSEYRSSTEEQIDLVFLAVSTESPEYGPALATQDDDDGANDSLEDYLAGWVNKPKRSESSLDSIFADETWM